MADAPGADLSAEALVNVARVCYARRVPALTIRSTTCSAHGHQELTLTLGRGLPVPGLEALLLAFFEHRVAKGVRFAAGQVVQFGGATLRLVSRDDGTLGVEELVPGPKAAWEQSVDRALMTTWTQNEIVRSVGLEHLLAFPRDVSSAVVCTRLVEQPGVFMRREAAADANDSGWFVACLDPAHDHRAEANLTGMVLSHLAAVCAPAVQFLALPPGTDVVVRGPGRVKAELAFEGKALVPAPGSYLELLNRG